MGKKSAANLMQQIERSKTRDFWRLIYGLGIRHVGERGAQALASAFGTMDALLAASKEQLQAVPDIGPVVAAAVRDYFDQPQNQALISELSGRGPEDGRAAALQQAPGSAERQDLRAHRHPRDAVARSRPPKPSNRVEER